MPKTYSKSFETKQKISIVVAELMLTKPHYKIKIDDVTERLGISRSTFYTYYDSIYSVVQQMMCDFFTDMPDLNIFLSVEKSNNAQPSKPMPNRNLLIKNTLVYKALAGAYGEPDFETTLIRKFQDEIYEMLQKGKYPEEKCVLCSEFLGASSYEWIKYTLFHSDNSVEQIWTDNTLHIHQIVNAMMKELRD